MTHCTPMPAISYCCLCFRQQKMDTLGISSFLSRYSYCCTSQLRSLACRLYNVKRKRIFASQTVERNIKVTTSGFVQSVVGLIVTYILPLCYNVAIVAINMQCPNESIMHAICPINVCTVHADKYSIRVCLKRLHLMIDCQCIIICERLFLVYVYRYLVFFEQYNDQYLYECVLSICCIILILIRKLQDYFNVTSMY